MALYTFIALALTFTNAVASQQCAEPTAGAQSPSPNYPIYISPNETCEFVLDVALFGGNCTPALNIATIAGPSPYNTHTATVTLTVGVSVGVPFATDIPAGQLPEGNYIINNELHFDAPPFDLGSLVIITHEPIIVNTDATSTLTVSSTQVVTQTVTVTGGQASLLTFTGSFDALDATPIVVLEQAPTATATSEALTTTVTTTITPKAATKVVSISVTSTSTASCIPATVADPQASPDPTPTTLARMMKREPREVFERGNQLRKRDICSNLGPQPTVTMYTSTVFSTVTSQVTETDTVTETQFNADTATLFTESEILRRAAATLFPITKIKTVQASRPTLTSTRVITVVVKDQAANCSA